MALLRGINVGGRNSLPMQALRELLAKLECENVATCIQSGNAVFTHSGTAADLSRSIADRIEARFQFRPQVLVMAARDFASIVKESPFVVPPGEEKQLHVWFFQKPVSQVNTKRLEELATSSERFAQTRKAFYLHAPDGIGRSKLAAEVEKCVGVPVTARNFRTIARIQELLDAL